MAHIIKLTRHSFSKVRCISFYYNLSLSHLLHNKSEYFIQLFQAKICQGFSTY